MIYGMIFDLDGTLADTIADLQKAMNMMLTHFGYETRDREQIKNAICYGQREFVKRSLPEEESRRADIVDECQKYYAKRYAECYNDSTCPYPMMRETLIALKERGIRLSVVTNKAQEHAEAVIHKCFPEGPFDIVIGGGSFEPKPSPQGALHAAGIMRLDPEHCLFVGDSDVDIMTGKNAGMKTVGVSWGYRPAELLRKTGADFVIESAVQLLRLL